MVYYRSPSEFKPLELEFCWGGQCGWGEVSYQIRDWGKKVGFLEGLHCSMSHVSDHLNLLVVVCSFLQLSSGLQAQTKDTPRPWRSTPPIFQQGQFDSVLFTDITSMMRGELPNSRVARLDSPVESVTNGNPPDSSVNSGWSKIISATTLEDLVKASKLRLDQIVTTPPAFVSGAYADARQEFSLQAVLFAIIEQYPDEVRWKKSATAARELMARVAANAKVGSQPVFNEAKLRLADLNDLMRGSTLSHKASDGLDWSKVVDRGPLMKLLEWAFHDHVTSFSASETAFDQNRDSLAQYAELMAVLGRVALQEGMSDADDEDYVKLANAMVDAAVELAAAVKNNDAELARRVSGQIGQTCTNCHEIYN
ncbi:MAG: cytochrome c [Planctomycetales bacterium]|nr:cytochrome c [Planctomycetales bacterium]